MNTYAPLWSSIVESSLWDEPDTVRIVFVTMLAEKDADHIVRLSAYQLGRKARKTEAETLEALRVLSEPDTKRLEPQPFEGRRIERVADGWLVLNGQKYRDLMSKIKRKEYHAGWMKKKRHPLPGETAYVRGIEKGIIEP